MCVCMGGVEGYPRVSTTRPLFAVSSRASSKRVYYVENCRKTRARLITTRVENRPTRDVLFPQGRSYDEEEGSSV